MVFHGSGSGHLIINPKCNYHADNHLLFTVTSVMAGNMKYAEYLALIALVLSAVLVSGCISSQPAPQDNPLPPLTTEPARALTTGTTVTTGTPPVHQTTTVTPAETITTTLPYGITISCPRDWIVEETGVTIERDYGREVVNVANLYSPMIPPGRKMGGLNPDASDNTILTVDVDEAGATDLESYFNHATVALQDEYGKIDITRHNLQLSISGYKAYRLDFDAQDLRGTYLFTQAGGRMYIFSFSNPTPYSSEVEAIYRSIIISP
jgi:hypothetical protein